MSIKIEIDGDTFEFGGFKRAILWLLRDCIKRGGEIVHVPTGQSLNNFLKIKEPPATEPSKDPDNLRSLHDQVKIATSSGNWDYDPYMQGIAPGSERRTKPCDVCNKQADVPVPVGDCEKEYYMVNPARELSEWERFRDGCPLRADGGNCAWRGWAPDELRNCASGCCPLWWMKEFVK